MTTAFVNGIVFVGDGKVLENATVLVVGDRIVKVGKAKTSVPKGATKIGHSTGIRWLQQPGPLFCIASRKNHNCMHG